MVSGREVITGERGALRLPPVERHQREAVAERRQIDPVGIQHFGARELEPRPRIWSSGFSVRQSLGSSSLMCWARCSISAL